MTHVAIQIQPYTEELTGAVAEFNRRMRPAGVPFRVPETTAPSWLPKFDGRKVHQEIFLAAPRLDILTDLARRRPDLLEVRIHGRPAMVEFRDFDAQVADAPGVSFGETR